MNDEEVDECIQDIKCKGSCTHIEEEDVRNLRALRRMKEQGGSRNSPQEKPDNKTVHRCTVHSVRSDSLLTNI